MGTKIAFSPDGQLAVADNGGAVILWDTMTSTSKHAVTANWVETMSFSPDGQLLASSCWDGMVRL
jgi:WD40 repeat protein